MYSIRTETEGKQQKMGMGVRGNRIAFLSFLFLFLEWLLPVNW